MKKIVIIIIIIILLIGGYIFIKDRRIKAELSKVEQAQVVGSSTSSSTSIVASEIAINRTNGVWKVDATGPYTIDPASISFKFFGYKPGGEHEGTFNSMDVNIALDKDGQPIASIMSMDIASVKTDSEGLDKHLQGEDFFDLAKSPIISVVMKAVKKDSDTNARTLSDVTLAGVTKTLTVPVTFTQVEKGTKFTVDTKISLKDFDISYGPVLDDVRIMVEGVMIKK